MRRFLLVAAALCLAACSDNNSTEPTGNLVGTYQLRTINGSQLPFTFSDGSTIVSDQLTLGADGTYNDVAQFSDGEVFDEQGFWNNNNGTILFDPTTGGGQYQGSVSGSVLTEIFPGGPTEVYQKTS